MQAIALFRTRTGIIRDSAEQSLSVDVEAYAPAGEDGIDRVEFDVSVNGAAPTTTVVAARTMRFPNYSDAASPIDGALPGMMAPFFGYGIRLLCSDLDTGTITVVARVYSGIGTMTPVPDTITLYNFLSADLRPSTKRIYFHPSGNDVSGLGTIASPRRTLPGAIKLARNNPSGSTLADLDCGGAECVAMSGPHFWVDASMPDSWHTSGHHWLTVVCEDGVTWNRSATSQFFIPKGAGAGTRCALKMEGTGSANAAKWFGLHCDVTVQSGVDYVDWHDGCRTGSILWSPGKLTVRYYEDEQDGGTHFTKVQAGVNYRSFLSCCTFEGVSDGIAAKTDAQDCLIRDFTTLAIGGGGWNGAPGGVDSGITNSGLNIVARHGYVNHPEVLGWIDVIGSSGDMRSRHKAGVLTITAERPLYGTRNGLPALDMPLDIGRNCAELAGSSVFQIKITGWPAYNGKWFVTSAGTDTSGKPYVTMAVPGTGLGELCPDSARMRIDWTDAFLASHFLAEFDPHGGLLHLFGDGAVNCIWSNIAATDIVNMQGPFVECDITRVAFVGIALASRYANFDLRVPFYRAKDGCVFAHNSFDSAWDFEGTTTNSVIANNVCRVSGGGATMPNDGVGGNEVYSNHFVTGATRGADARTGPFFASPPGVAPWSFEPIAGEIATGSASSPMAPDWRWPGAPASPPSRGVGRNVGTQSWAVAVDTLTITPAAATDSASAGGATFSASGVTVANPVAASSVEASDPAVTMVGFVVTPAAAASAAEAAGPVVSLGGFTVTEVASSSESTAGPDVSLNGLFLRPDPAVTAESAIAPVVTVGPLVITPLAASDRAHVGNGFVVYDGIAISPPPAVDTCRTVGPTFIAGSISIDTPPASSRGGTSAIWSARSITITPAPAESSASTGDPLVTTPIQSVASSRDSTHGPDLSVIVPIVPIPAGATIYVGDTKSARDRSMRRTPRRPTFRSRYAEWSPNAHR